jgi:hypothetical protein
LFFIILWTMSMSEWWRFCANVVSPKLPRYWSPHTILTSLFCFSEHSGSAKCPKLPRLRRKLTVRSYILFTQSHKDMPVPVVKGKTYLAENRLCCSGRFHTLCWRLEFVWTVTSVSVFLVCNWQSLAAHLVLVLVVTMSPMCITLHFGTLNCVPYVSDQLPGHQGLLMACFCLGPSPFASPTLCCPQSFHDVTLIVFTTSSRSLLNITKSQCCGAGAGTFGPSRYTKVSAPAPGQTKLV